MKRTIAFILAVICLLCFPFTVFAEEDNPEPELIEEYVNTKKTNCSLSILSSGNVTIAIVCQGYEGTTHISSRTYLEKRVGSSWERVCINGASEIQDGASGDYFSNSYSTTVGSGRYRATVIFTVTRYGTDETITAYSSIVNH